MPQISCKSLTLGYEGKAVVNNLTFNVNKGDYLCIVGENGSGKSTLMKALLGLITPISGDIKTFDGVTKKEIGYLPQQTVVQKDFPASVWEIVLSGCQGRCGIRPYYNKSEKSLAKENMQKMNIEKLSTRCFRELSGGQQQRVLLARALCAAKKVLLLDEPVAGLDPKVTEEMYDLIKKLNKEENITIIMISHDVNASIKYASHILHIGNEIFFGTCDKYIKSGVCSAFSPKKGNPKND